jgi:hypothetical protein
MDKRRHHVRAAQEYFLANVAVIGALFPKDLLHGVVWLAVHTLNTTHLLDDPELGERYASMQTPVPDAERRPVTRSAVAQALGIPLETCRRHVNALVAEGRCVEVDKRGVMVPADQIETAEVAAVAIRNAHNLRRLLDRLGVEAEL